MEILILFTAIFCSQPVISEVCSNPVFNTSGEFVEIYNASDEPLDITGYSITDGDALDELLPWISAFPQTGVVTESSIIPAGSYAILLEEDYPIQPWLTFAEGTVILTTGDHSICNGLATSDPLTLYSPSGTTQSDVVSTFGTPLELDNWSDCDDDDLDSIPFDPGEGLSIGRYPLLASDGEGYWFAGETTPGAATEAPPDTFIITIDSLFLSDSDPVPGTSVLFTVFVSCWGTVSPDSGEIVLFIDINGDSVSQWNEELLSYPACNLSPGESDTLQVYFTAHETGWYPAVCSAVDATSRIQFSTGGGINPIITEIMANPLIEDQEEFIEVYYPGPGVFLLSGCYFTDGDAVDLIVPLGSPYIKAQETVLIIDPEYQGTLNIPSGTSLFTPANTTIGNGLTTDDPILIYLPGEPSLMTLLATAGTPLLYDDPLLCDDDGLDNISFDPGNGNSMERISTSGPDAEFNWKASEPGGTPGIVTENEGWTDLCTDSIWVSDSIQAIFRNNGVFDAEGICTIFSDGNGDLTPGSSEIIHQQSIFLSAGESNTLVIPFTQPDSGLFVYAAAIQNTSDTITSNNIKHCNFIPDHAIWPVITEVLCNPSNEDCDEFIELFFPGPGLADITQFFVTDNDAIDALTAVETPFLTPGSYGLILDTEYENGAKPYDIPDGTAIFHPANSTIGDGLSSTDPVLLLIDSMVVSGYGTPENQDDDIPFDPGTDLSVERIHSSLPDLEENWISLSAPTPGTCPTGITQGVDYSVISVLLSPPMGQKDTETEIQVLLTCVGTDTIATEDLSLKIFTDDMIINTSSPFLPKLGDTISITANWQSVTELSVITAEIICEYDSNPLNDVSETIWNPSPTLCLNEIFYNETEWVELFNGTENTVSLSEIVFADPGTTSLLTEEVLSPGEYIILTANEDDFYYRWGSMSCSVVELDPWPTLNNSGDTLFLFDKNQILDMVPYTSHWGGNANASIERRTYNGMGFHQDNWGTSISSATPGRVNSICEISSNEFLSLTPYIFNPPETPLRIEVNLPMQACDVTVKVFDVRGMELENLYSSIVPGEVLILEWYGEQYPVGRYIIFVEASCSGTILNDAQVVILARRLSYNE